MAGYDLCTGLGTPARQNLITALIGPNSSATATAPILASPTLNTTTDTFSFAWPSSAGLTYQIQYKTNLMQTNWNDLGTALAGIGASMNFSDTNSSDPQRFYRLSVSQSP